MADISSKKTSEMAESVSVSHCLEHETVSITILRRAGNGPIICQMDIHTATEFIDDFCAAVEKILTSAMARLTEKPN